MNLKEIEPYIIFSAIMGSRAFGTHLPTSDTDIRGVFIQPPDSIFRDGYIDQVADEKADIVYYELRKYLHLAQSNNPSVIELMFAPQECILKSTLEWRFIFEKRQEFLTKVCKHSFSGYAIGQIKKARGYNKKINWEENEMVRKIVLDFCYVLEEGKNVPFKEWNKAYNENNTFGKEYPRYSNNFGLAKVNHARDTYAMYDLYAEQFNLKVFSAGITSTHDASDVRLTSIPKGTELTGYLTFNKDAFSLHCKKYSEYQEWLKKRNVDRFKMNKEHGKNYDSKNMMHTYRLLNVSLEIARDGVLNVRRPKEEIETLMKIRRGEFEYDELMSKAELLIKQIDDIYDKSNLPNKVDQDFVNDLILKIRKYNINYNNIFQK